MHARGYNYVSIVDTNIQCITLLCLPSWPQQLTCALSEQLESEAAASRSSAASPPTSSSGGTNYLEIDDAETSFKRNLILLSLLASMCEKLGHTCFKSTKHILQFAKVELHL